MFWIIIIIIKLLLIMYLKRQYTRQLLNFIIFPIGVAFYDAGSQHTEWLEFFSSVVNSLYVFGFPCD